MIDPLLLAGPSERVQQAIEAIRGGKVLISGEAVRTLQLIESVVSVLPSHGFDLIPLGADHTFDHAANALEVDSVSDPGRLLQAPRLNRTVLKIDCRSPRWRDWGKLFLTKLSSAHLSQSLKLWMVWPDAAPRPSHRSLAHLEWKGCLTPSDVRIFAADRFRGRQGPGPTHYWESLAAELAGPDLDLIERMAQSRSPLYDPIAWLLADTGVPAPAEAYDGMTAFESSLLLARRSGQDPRAAETLHRRIWSAQVRTLLVALEAERPGVLAPFKRELELSYKEKPAADHEQVEVIPRDVEWGPAHSRLSRLPTVSAPVRQLLEAARKLRNHLAHGEAMGPAVLQDVVGVFAAVLKGRWANTR